MKKILVLFLMLFSTLVLAEDTKVVFHLDEADRQTAKTIRQINNQLNVDSSTKITIVASGQGLEIFMKGYSDAKGSEYLPALEQLRSRGVKFEACTYSMGVRGITKDKMIDNLDYVPSGSGRITELQAKEHFVYFKP